MPAIKIHHTEIDTGTWDAGANVARLRSGESAAYYARMFAWRDPAADDTTKGAYKFPHHIVDADGNPGPANIKGCQSGIGVLNGAMGGADIPDADRRAVYNHLAAHLRDGDVEPAELNSLLGPEIERRSFIVELRADGDPGAQPTINGTAAVFGALSEVLWGFREIIEPGFFENVLEQDVRALWNHNSDMVLGRTKNQTLELIETERGLEVKILPSDTSWGRDAVESIRRGDVDQMSFGFSVRIDGDSWSKDPEGNLIRTLKRGGCERLFDVSPVAFPAYPQTSTYVRSMAESFDAGSQAAPAGAGKGASAKVRNANILRKLEIEKRR